MSRCYHILYLAFALSAWQGSAAVVVTSFVPLYCWTANVAGSAAQVENLLSARAEPHEYAFTPGDARKLHQADLVIVNGLGLETWLPKWIRGEPQAASKLITIADGMAPHVLSGATRDANPHLWLDPRLACIGVSNIAAALQRIDPVHATIYASNAMACIARLRQLDADIEQGLAAITNRAIVTYHDAFPYFAHRYGLEIAGVVEQVPEVNPTPKYLARLSRTIRKRRITAIFIAANSSSRLARQIADDLRVKLIELDTLEAGQAVPDAYETRMRSNLAVLRSALQ